MSINDISLSPWPRNIANNEANLREISSKDFGIIELKMFDYRSCMPGEWSFW